ncbi:hypothetical protein [Massilia scottii]|uniref:hypothetical protein n=1 Tax=Massilia scottii TaxID=3057166 RepID=UPI0027969D52|nr:hypothetical protein [Massilia sp. CCM 9029]MDQ1832010.1 hypothetical protein [Massilia sp. CCM 9029]
MTFEAAQGARFPPARTLDGIAMREYLDRQGNECAFRATDNGHQLYNKATGAGTDVALKKWAASTGKMANCVKDQHLCAKSSISWGKFKFSATRPDSMMVGLYESLFNLRNVNADLT